MADQIDGFRQEVCVFLIACGSSFADMDELASLAIPSAVRMVHSEMLDGILTICIVAVNQATEPHLKFGVESYEGILFSSCHIYHLVT
jgi:hypothetical protein